MPAVAVFAPEDDELADSVSTELQRRDQEVLRVPDERLLGDVGLSWRLGDGGFIELDSRRVSFEQLSAVFARNRFPLPLPDRVPDEDREYVAREAFSALSAILSSLRCRVVNRPVPRRPAPSALLASAAGLARAGFVPASGTLVESPEQAIAALEQFDRATLFVSPLGGVPGLAEPGADHEALTLAARNHALWLQPIPAGDRHRVYVVGGQVIGSDAPERVVAPCLRLTAALGLELAEIWLVDTAGAPVLLTITTRPDPEPPALERVAHALTDLFTRR